VNHLNQLIRGAGMVLLQREIPEEVNAEVAEVAAAAGVPVVLDAGGREGALDPGLLRRLAVLSPNETELARMTGMPTGSAEQVEAAAAALLGEGVGAVLVKLGSKGSLLLRPGETPFQQDAVPVEKIVDTTGAGDCYTAAWAVGRLRGLSPERAMAFACESSLPHGRPSSLPPHQQRGRGESPSPSAASVPRGPPPSPLAPPSRQLRQPRSACRAWAPPAASPAAPTSRSSSGGREASGCGRRSPPPQPPSAPPPLAEAPPQ